MAPQGRREAAGPRPAIDAEAVPRLTSAEPLAHRRMGSMPHQMDEDFGQVASRTRRPSQRYKGLTSRRQLCSIVLFFAFVKECRLHLLTATL